MICDLQVKNKAPILEYVTIHREQESQEKKLDMKKSFDKILAEKDKEIACLRNRSQILLTKVKK